MKQSLHIMKLRVIIGKALTLSDDIAWNDVRSVIAKILSDCPEMEDHAEVIACNSAIYRYFNDTQVKVWIDSINSALTNMDHSLLHVQLDELSKFELDAKFQPLVDKSKYMLNCISECRDMLTTGMEIKDMDILRQGLQIAANISYSKHLVWCASSFYKKYNSFRSRITAAALEYDATVMRELLDEAMEYGIDEYSQWPELKEMHHMVYEITDEQLLEIQLEVSINNGDPKRVCDITIKMKAVFFERQGNKFKWMLYPYFLTPDAWSKASLWPFGREKLKKQFWIWNKNPIHHPLTDLERSINVGSVMVKGSHSVSKLHHIQKEATQMFKNILGIMCDRKYGMTPLSLARDILSKCEKYKPLRNEFFAQIIKQLTLNPKEVSIERGWNLFTVFLDTFKPNKDIENYVEFWLRGHPPPHRRPDFYVRLLHRTIFQGSRSRLPTLEEIADMFEGEIRKLPMIFVPISKKKKKFDPKKQGKYCLSGNEYAVESKLEEERDFDDEKVDKHEILRSTGAQPPKVSQNQFRDHFQKQRSSLIQSKMLILQKETYNNNNNSCIV